MARAARATLSPSAYCLSYKGFWGEGEGYGERPELARVAAFWGASSVSRRQEAGLDCVVMHHRHPFKTLSG